MKEKYLNLIFYGTGVTHALRTAISLNLFEIINQMPCPTDILSNKLQINSQGTERFLDFLRNLGFLKRKHSKWHLTTLGYRFAIDNKEQVSEFLLLSSKEICNSWENLEYSLNTNKPSFEQIYKNNFFEYLKKTPKALDVYHSGWGNITKKISEDLIKKYNFEQYEKIVDIGGGNGTLISEILKEFLNVTGTIVEKPYIKNEAKLYLRKQNLTCRCNFMTTDIFFQTNLKTDLIIMKSFIHLFDNKTVLNILKHCQSQLNKNGKILIIERFLSRKSILNRGVFTDMTMFLVTAGKERDQKEIYDLFQQVKIKPLKTILLLYGFVAYEGVKQ